jgi:hypothetical protein
MYRGVNRNQLKYLAILAMLCDHVATYILPSFHSSSPWLIALYYILKIIGRMAAPTMCFFLVQGFLYSRNHRNYLIRLAVCAVVAQVPYAYLNHGTLLTYDFNFAFTLLIGFALLTCYSAVQNPLTRWLGVLILTLLSNFCEGGVWAVMWIAGFFFFRYNKQYSIYSFAVITVVQVLYYTFYTVIAGGAFYAHFYLLGALLFIPCLYSFNGNGGSRKPFHKWFFYVFYPVELILMYVLTAFVL